MNLKSFSIISIIFLGFSANIIGQSTEQASNTLSPRVIVTSTLPAVVESSKPRSAPTPVVTARTSEIGKPDLTYHVLSLSQIKSKIAEAKREMQSHPTRTSSVQTENSSGLVQIAYYDWRLRRIDYFVISKDQFLTTDVLVAVTSASGKNVISRTIRANGVNTPVTIVDEDGQQQLPLLVQYPVERGGKFIETAYYMSSHPGLVTPEVVNAGRLYVHNTIEIARDRLKANGVKIQPEIADAAERLATVEHVDHFRFRTENPLNIFNDIFTLYALNEGQTYRYSVSSAGAGGMVQMIPSTYSMIRSRYPSVGLKPDFVEGMRDHINASRAMLLYMQMTWDDLIASPVISAAIQSGIARPEQLMAAGYNSNPAKLSGYLKRGGENWINLIPRETKIYLQIYNALERTVPAKARPR